VSKCPMIVLILLVSMLSASALSQETIFNVPSGDILDKEKSMENSTSHICGIQASELTRRV
jgi:hypothetical protein